jgi:(S)-ureidoglycine aminohydrolase
MKACSAIVHVSPSAGAKFAQYTAEFESGGELGGTDSQRFIYVLEGSLQLDVDGRKLELGGNAYAYLPNGSQHRVMAARSSRAAVIEKPYQPLPMVTPPKLLVSIEGQISSHALGDDPSLQVKCLLPDEMAFDFAVNTMVYQPGAALSMVEMHVMEHGLLMLEGGGIYRLDDSWHSVTAGDFIYKDSNRHPLAGGPHESRG